MSDKCELEILVSLTLQLNMWTQDPELSYNVIPVISQTAHIPGQLRIHIMSGDLCGHLLVGTLYSLSTSSFLLLCFQCTRQWVFVGSPVPSHLTIHTLPLLTFTISYWSGIY